MAEDSKTEVAVEQPKPKRVVLAAVIAGVGITCGGIGFAIPILFPQTTGTGRAAGAEVPQIDFIEYGDCVANLNEDALTRYLRVKLSLEINENQKEDLSKLVEKKRPILQSWLLKHLSGKTMDDIRGEPGQNRLRREIQDKFNDVLFPDGYDEIKNVHFLEFSIQ